MTTQFDSPEQAKAAIARMAGLNPDEAEFEENSELKVGGLETLLLDDPDTSEELKAAIRQRIEAQKGYSLKTPEGEDLRIVIGPFRDGFDLWLIAENGMGMRL